MQHLLINEMKNERSSGHLCFSTAIVSMHPYNYPNKVTLEACYTDKPLSYFYREDGHPRPTFGRLIFANVLDLPIVGEQITVADDFGIGLMSKERSEAEKIISEKKAGCEVQRCYVIKRQKCKWIGWRCILVFCWPSSGLDFPR